MDWKLFILVIITAARNLDAHPGVRTPPTELEEKFFEEAELTLETNDTKITPLLKDGRDFPKVHSNPFLRDLNRTTPTPPTLPTPSPLISSKPSSRFDQDDFHQGIAVPLTQEELEKEMSSANMYPSSTVREGLSTWILLSGTATTPQPSKKPMTTAPTSRKEDKIAKIEKIEQITPKPSPHPSQKPANKPRPKPTSLKNTRKPDTTQRPVESQLGKRKKPMQEVRPNAENKQSPQQKKKPTTTTTTTTTSTTTTSTTPVPQTELATTSEHPVTSTTAETTTFLILEPKDADFDMPEDRSPGSTTKKPKRKNANKKNKKKNSGLKTEIAEKKPINQNKDKPLTTQIYNYLAREVMPTVGVGLVGLALTAGLATYFLGTPFGALRRSYDINDRKDDTYYYNGNNEEYAGTDGQSEEEVFGKVIAGMPVNSPYRNSIQYSIYRPAQAPAVQYEPKYAARNPQRYPMPQAQPVQQHIRYRVNDPSYYNQQQQYQQNVYSNQKPYEQNLQQYFRYNTNDGSAFRTSGQSAEIQKTFSNYPSDIVTGDSSLSNDPSVKIKIVTPGSTTTEVEPITDPSVLDNDVLQRRTQFVVGSVQSVAKDEMAPSSETPILETVPEHGPRRRRRRREAPAKSDLSTKINENENEIDGPLPDEKDSVIEKIEKPLVETNKETHQAMSTTTSRSSIDVFENMDGLDEADSYGTSSTESYPVEPLSTSIFSLIRNIVELKVRMGLSFLRNTTESFGHYLRDVEKRIDESKVFPGFYRRVNPKLH